MLNLSRIRTLQLKVGFLCISRSILSSKSDSDDIPPPPSRPSRPRGRGTATQHLESDSDDGEPPFRPPSRAHGRGTTVHRLTRINEPVASPFSESSKLGPWIGYRIDQDKYAWAEDMVLTANTKSADCQAFYGEHTEHRSFN